MKRKSITYNKEELIKKMSEDLSFIYQIGTHQIGVGEKEIGKKQIRKKNVFKYLKKITPKDYCESIIESGLINRWKSLEYTLQFYGSLDNINQNRNIKEIFLNAYYKKDSIYEIIVAIPSIININGKNFYLGTLNYGNASESEDRMISLFRQRDIPSEYIYGYVQKYGDTFTFVSNPNHICNKTEKEQEKFFSKWIETYTDEERKIMTQKLKNESQDIFRKKYKSDIYININYDSNNIDIKEKKEDEKQK